MMTRHTTRREFIKLAGAAGAAVMLGAGAGCTAPSAQPPAAEADGNQPEGIPLTFKKGTEENMKILIAYATRTGSTTSVAKAVGEELTARGFTVDVLPVTDAPALDGYQAVILGSAINGGKWLPEAVEYAEKHRHALKKLPSALFCVHIMNLGDDEASRKNRKAYLNGVRELVNPSAESYFAGVGGNPDEIPGIVRWIYRTLKLGGEGDCRDWTKIRGWGKELWN